MVCETTITIKINYITENGSKKTDTVTLYYYVKSNLLTKNAFDYISNKLKEQLNLNRNEYIYIHFNNGVLIPFNTNSNEMIYDEFNGNPTVPFYINILTHESYQAMVNFLLPECPICMNRNSNLIMVSPYRCGHRICSSCHQRCRETNHFSCCYCREEILINPNGRNDNRRSENIMI